MKLDYATLGAKPAAHLRLNQRLWTSRPRPRPRRIRLCGRMGASGLMATIAEPGHAPPAQRPAMIDHPVGLSLAGAVSAALLLRAHRERMRGQDLAVRDGPVDELGRFDAGAYHRTYAVRRSARSPDQSAMELLPMQGRALDLLRDDPKRAVSGRHSAPRWSIPNGATTRASRTDPRVRSIARR